MTLKETLIIQVANQSYEDYYDPQDKVVHQNFPLICAI